MSDLEIAIGSQRDSKNHEQKSIEIVALVGAPNSGKTTLYNWLTNSKFKTVNYPGATVEYSLGTLGAQYGPPFLVMDTPGTYSLFPKSADEEVTVKALLEHPEYGAIKKVIVVIDGTQLARHILLAKQIREAGFGLVIAVTMSDLLRQNGVQIDLGVLRKEFQCPVVLIEGLLGGGVQALVKELRDVPGSMGKKLSPWSEASLSQKLKDADVISERALGGGGKTHKIYETTAQIDRVLLHHVWGLFIFAAIMIGLFSSIFWLAKPFMEWVDLGFEELNQLVLRMGPGELWADFLGQGLIKSFGAVMIFVPQIFILFFGIGLLESSGYLARAATLIDKPFSKLGMSGRSFVPILSGFACAVPALMATRNISSKRDRWITNFIIPLMTCSARLPVYALLLSFLFIDQPAWKAGVTLAGLYLGSLFLGAISAAILNSFIKKSGASIFMMELPMYRQPVWKTLMAATVQRTWSYVKRAGPMIFIFSTVVWVGTTFPNYEEKTPQVQLESSYLGRIGHVIEPVFTPMGGDWRTGVGLLSAFAARETFVSSLAVLFGSTESDQPEEEQSQSLLKAMSQAKAPSGESLFTVSSVLGLIVFFAIAMQCLSTFAMAAKETKSLRFAWAQLVVFNVVAYVLSVALVQGLRALGVS